MKEWFHLCLHIYWLSQNSNYGCFWLSHLFQPRKSVVFNVFIAIFCNENRLTDVVKEVLVMETVRRVEHDRRQKVEKEDLRRETAHAQHRDGLDWIGGTGNVVELEQQDKRSRSDNDHGGLELARIRSAPLASHVPHTSVACSVSRFAALARLFTHSLAHSASLTRPLACSLTCSRACVKIWFLMSQNQTVLCQREYHI